ncbi:MAG: lysine biosynthesis protein LysW [Phycisphaerales bacterium JB040]
MPDTISAQTNCPECDAPITFDRAPLNGQIARCTDCGVELEVVSTQPLTLEIAPEVEEDWGE